MRGRKSSKPNVAITLNEDESSAILEGLGLLSAEGLIDNNDVVVITPNWVKKLRPETATVVGNESLRTIINYVKAQNPRRIVVASGSGGNETVESMETSDFDDVLRQEGIEFVDLNYGPFTRVSLNHDCPGSTNLNKLYQEMTCHISFTQLKVHEEATVSGALKNVALSWPPASEHGFPKKELGIHEKLHEFIVAMSEVIPIDISIVSASPAMVGTGPVKGLPRNTGLVITGTDPYSVDTVGARLLGYKTQAVRYLYEGTLKRLGETDILKMNISGIPIIEAEREFGRKVYGSPVSVDAD